MKKSIATTNDCNCEKLYHDTKQRNRKKLSHNKEFVFVTYYSSVQVARYSRIVVTQENLCHDIN